MLSGPKLGCNSKHVRYWGVIMVGHCHIICLTWVYQLIDWYLWIKSPYFHAALPGIAFIPNAILCVFLG